MDSVSPVWSEEEVEIECVIALDQFEYAPIIALPVRYNDGHSGVAVRFRFSEAEKKAIADGADLIITELTFGGPFTPIGLQLCQPNERPF